MATKKVNGSKLSAIDKAELEINERMARDMLAQGLGGPNSKKPPVKKTGGKK